MKKFLAFGSLAIALLIGGCSGPDSSSSDQISAGQESTVSDLTGVWSDKTVETVDSEDTWMEAVITEGTISIDWVSDGGDTRWIYWVGTFDSKIEGALPQKVFSERNAEETDRALLASSDDTKEFTFEDGQLSYSQSALGQTRKIVLEKQSAGNGAPFSTSQEESPAVEIVDSGFGQNGTFTQGVVIVTSTGERSVGEFVTVSVNFLGTEGEILSTEEQVESFNWVGQELVLPISFLTDRSDVTVASMDPSVTLSDYGGGNSGRAPLPVLEATEITPSQSGEYIASFEFTNETGEDLEGLRVGTVCRDETGEINGGTSTYPSLAPAGRTIRIDANVTVSGQPASCDAYLNY